MQLPDFSNTKFSLQRPLTDYAKVQGLYSRFARNSMRQLRGLNFAERPFLNLGCGPFPHPDFINADYDWRPGIQLCWDFRRKIPLPEGVLAGLFSEHCLEHLTKDDARSLLAGLKPAMKPNGRVRIVVPDAELYLDIYMRRRAGESVLFPYEAPDTQLSETPMDHVNRIFRNYGHLFAYDFTTMKKLLIDAGYRDIERCGFREGKVSKLLIDREDRKEESLYIEASV